MSFQRFFHAESTSGILLMAITVVALFWSNTASESYVALWETRLAISFGGFHLDKPLLIWINDALMALFFFVVGLEIKREVLVGELAHWRHALFPIAAAIGGMVVPVGMYLLLAYGAGGGRGWAVPMATDIAFSLGVLALLGSRIPTGLKVFLAALAIVDDLGAIIVIAVFYTEQIAWGTLLLGLAFLAVMFLINKLGARDALPFFLLGTCVWLCFLKSGIHPTIAGVLGALAIPARTAINATQFLEKARGLLGHFERHGHVGKSVLTNTEQRGALHSLEVLTAKARSPLHQLEHVFHPWVVFLVMPIFALANAGIAFPEDFTAAVTHRLTLGIALSLVVGKFLGVFGGAYLMERLGLASRPRGVSWRHIAGVALLAGIGFTMALFISGLAFEHVPEVLVEAKLGIFIGSFVAGVAGWWILKGASSTEQPSSLSH